MASQSVPVDELKHDLHVEPDHGGICNGNITDMEVVIEAETKINGEEEHSNGMANGDSVHKVSTTDAGDDAKADANKENEVPGATDINSTKSNGEVLAKSTTDTAHLEPSTKKQSKTKRRSSSSSSSKHKRPKPKPTTTSNTMVMSSSTSILFGLISYKDYQLRDPIVAFETSLESTNDWMTWLRLELIELVFDSTWRNTDNDNTTSLNQYTSLSQVFGGFILIGFSLTDYALRFAVVLIVAVIKLYLHLIRGIVGVGVKKIGFGGKATTLA